MRYAHKKSGTVKDVSFTMIGMIVIVAFIAVVIHINEIELNNKVESFVEREVMLQKEIDEENQRTAILTERKKYVKTKEYIKEVARKKLGLIEPDEIVIKAREN